MQITNSWSLDSDKWINKLDRLPKSVIDPITVDFSKIRFFQKCHSASVWSKVNGEVSDNIESLYQKNKGLINFHYDPMISSGEVNWGEVDLINEFLDLDDPLLFEEFEITNGIKILSLRDSDDDGIWEWRFNKFFKLEEKIDLLFVKSTSQWWSYNGDEWEISNNDWVRTKFDYNNFFDLDLKDFYLSGSSSIAVGEFGQIILTKDNFSYPIFNTWREDILSLTKFNDDIFLSTKRGTILKLKLDSGDLEHFKTLGEFNLNSIEFKFGLLVTVGDFNNIWISDGGKNFIKLSFDNFKDVNWKSLLILNSDEFLVGGTRGVFLKFTRSLGRWTSKRIRFTKRPSDNFEDWIDIVGDIIDIKSKSDLVFLLTNSGDLIKLIGDDFTIYELVLNTGFRTFSLLNDDIVTGTNEGIWTFGLTGSEIYQNTISVTGSKISDVFANHLDVIDDEIYWVGPGTKFQKIDNNGDVSMFGSGLDSIKSRLLFLDYDLAKMNYWFDDFGQWRIPNRISFNGTPINFKFRPILNETGWLKLWSDRSKSIGYLGGLTESNLVYPNLEFSSVVDNKLVNVQIFKELESGLMPNKPNLSNWNLMGLTPSLNTPNGIYLYDDVGVLVSDNYSVDLGDILEISGESFVGNFLVNRIHKEEFNNQISNSSVDIFLGPSFYLGLFGNGLLFDLADFELRIEFLDKVDFSVGLSSSTISITGSNVEWSNIVQSAVNLFNEIPNVTSNLVSLGSGNFKISLESNLDYSQFIPFIRTTHSWTIGSNSGVGLNTSLGGQSQQPFSEQISSLVSKGFYWFYTNFEENQPNNGGTASVLNLNKYKEENLLETFSKHPVSNSYELLEFDGKLELRGKFSEESAYYNLETDILINGTTYSMEYSDEFKKFGYLPTYNILDYLSQISNKFHQNKEFENFESISLTSSVIVNNKIITDLDINPPIWTFWNLDIDGVIYEKFFLEEFTGGRLIFDKPIPSGLTASLISRNKLEQISSDLEELSLINRKHSRINPLGGWNEFEREFIRKYPTDSYAKILLEDSDIREELTGIMYTDKNGVFTGDLINLVEETSFETLSSTQSGLEWLVEIGTHSFSEGNFVKTNGTLTPIVGVSQSSIILKIQPSETIEFIDFDPKLGFRPIQLSNINKSDMSIPRRITPDSISIKGDNFSLNRVSSYKNIAELTGGITWNLLREEFTWLTDSEFYDAVIGKDINGPIFSSGKFLCGRWFKGDFKGDWISGDFYGGRFLNKWFSGRFFMGDFTGEWFSGRWFDGTFKGGQWYSGIWNKGIWMSGDWLSGIWISGRWLSGNFSSKLGDSIWINGEFRGGNFLNGVWMRGLFENSKFGGGSTKAIKSIWHNGTFVNSEFLPGLVESYYKNSQFKSGTFISSKFIGGQISNSEFSNSEFLSGLALTIPFTKNLQEITIEGEWIQDIGSHIFIYEDNPIFKILNKTYDIHLNQTKLTLDKVPNGDFIINLFTGSKFHSGIWYGGHFNKGQFIGGLWLDGLFKDSKFG